MMKRPVEDQDVRVLLLAARAGSPAAIDALCRIYDGKLRRIAWRYRGVSFEDALQEARLAFLLCIQSYDFGRGGDFGAYVWRKVRGDVRSRMRRLWTVTGRSVYADAPMDGDGGLGSRWDWLLGNGAGRDAAREVNQGLNRDLARDLPILLDDARLSPRERFAIEAGLAGYTLAEVAQAEGVSIETVKTWRKRAYVKLRRCLREDRM